MRKKLVVLITVIFVFSGSAAADIYYEVGADQDEILMNSTVRMECDTDEENCPVNVWTVTLNRPENSEIIGLESSYGNVDRYDVTNDRFTVETESEEPKSSVTIRARYRIDKPAKKVKDGLFFRSIGLSGFQGEQNYGSVKADNLINAELGYGFQKSVQRNRLNFSGEGPTNVKINFGEGYETKYFEFFGAEPVDTETAYEVAVGTVGFTQSYDRMPVAVLTNEVYNQTVNRWSRGQYLEGRLVLRQGLEDDFLPVLAHEAVHGLNAERLNWDETDSSYFDEGIAKYVEFLVRKSESTEPTREIFGEEVSYIKEENGRRYRYTLPSKGDREVLWRYYQDDRGFMKYWSSSSVNREFGYAYSELVIRNYVANGGSIRELYDEIDPDTEIEDNEDKWELYSKHLDMTPCKYESRERFESCLDEINEYDYPVYTASPEKNGSSGLRIQKMDLPNQTGSEQTHGSNKGVLNKSEDDVSGNNSFWNRFFTNLGGFIADLFGGL